MPGSSLCGQQLFPSLLPIGGISEKNPSINFEVRFEAMEGTRDAGSVGVTEGPGKALKSD
jgi:hypothetical protein